MNQKINIRQQVSVCIGETALPVGQLIYVQQGQRENTAFAYDSAWLDNANRFKVSPDLELVADYQQRKATSKADSPFHFAFADTAPDAWGRRVIARAHAKARRTKAEFAPELAPEFASLTELDYLQAVDDHSRVGALRLRDAAGNFLGVTQEGRATPALIDLPKLLNSSRAIELGNETLEDLRYLLGRGTSLGGMRPKCTIVDQDGRLAIGKFPSIGDARSVTRGEVLAMKLARLAGIDVATAHIVEIETIPVAIISRFDRTLDGMRIPYLSAASMLQASRDEDRSYFEIADAIRANCSQPNRDLHELWRRMVFNLLINNVDDHLQNHGFLHVSNGQWQLAPAFDINPFPDKERASKTWLSERDGPIVNLAMLLARSEYFALTLADAQRIADQVTHVVANWKTLAISSEVNISVKQLDDFSPSFRD
jgi:serine/threonine-protein kinase HipA